MRSATSPPTRRPAWSAWPICARCRRASTARNGAAISWPPCSAGSRAIRLRCRSIEKPRGNSNGGAIVELLKVLLRMTSERHAVASKIIATVDDLEQIAAGRPCRRRRAAWLAPRIVRRSGAGAEAWPAGAGDRKGPGRQGRSRGGLEPIGSSRRWRSGLARIPDRSDVAVLLKSAQADLPCGYARRLMWPCLTFASSDQPRDAESYNMIDNKIY